MPNGRPTHDAYDQKGVTSKHRQTRPLFSIECAGENSQSCAKLWAEPTMSLIANRVRSQSGKATSNHVIEIRARSALALKGNGYQPYDVFESKGLILTLTIYRRSRASIPASLKVASTLGRGFYCRSLIADCRLKTGIATSSAVNQQSSIGNRQFPVIRTQSEVRRSSSQDAKNLGNSVCDTRWRAAPPLALRKGSPFPFSRAEKGSRKKRHAGLPESPRLPAQQGG